MGGKHVHSFKLKNARCPEEPEMSPSYPNSKEQKLETRNDLSGPIRMRRRPNSPPNRERIEPGKGGWESVPEKPESHHTADKKDTK
jgi:hypothetical protein